MARRSFGNVRRLASGRWQAQYRWRNRGYTAATTFSCQCRGACSGPRKCRGWKAADAELGRIRREIEAGKLDPAVDRVERSRPPTPELLTVGEFFETWLAEREIGGYARDHYRSLWSRHVEPTFGRMGLGEVTPAMVSAWYARLCREDPARRVPDRPAMRAHAYGLLAALFRQAVDHEIVEASPCRVRKATRIPKTEEPEALTLPELDALVAATPERWRAMVLLAAWCSLRYGEVAVLRRADLDLDAGLVRVRRTLTQASGGKRIKDAAKSDAGLRRVTIPPHIVEDLRDHLERFAQPGRDGLLFPTAAGEPLTYSGRDLWFTKAREAAGRPDATFHQLRHFGQTRAAEAGANFRELMERAGQVSPRAALRYVHRVEGRQREIAEALSAMASGDVTPIASRRRRKTS